jgi:hypothetical protein
VLRGHDTIRDVRWSCAMGLGLLACASLGGCRDVLGIDDRRSDDAEGGGGGTTTGATTGGSCNLGIFSTVPTPPCRSCLSTGGASCCAAIDACAADEACASCLRADGACPSPPPSAYEELVSCVRGSCASDCYPTPGVRPDIVSTAYDLAPPVDDCVELSETVTCNPLVQSPTCNWQAGAACDVSPRDTFPSGTGFACYLSNRRHIGEACGLVEGTCHFGLTCADYRCARFCCRDGDCGAGARCDPAWLEWKFGTGPGSQDIGICVVD